MDDQTLHEALVKTLRRSLIHLYDPVVLRKSVLQTLLPANAQQDPVGALQRLLTEAIAALKPAANVPVGAPAWRIYHILHYRYVEQFLQREVANDLALSIRQVRRLESRALSVLADRLWTRYDFAARPDLLAALREQAAMTDEPEPEDETPDGADHGDDAEPVEADPSHAQELAWLKSSLTDRQTDLRDVLDGVLLTLAPLRAAHGAITTALPPDLPPLTVSPVGLRQVLLNLIATAVRLADGSAATLEGQLSASELRLAIRTAAGAALDAESDARLAETLAMSAQLMQLSGGELEVTTTAPFAVTLHLPTHAQLPILAVDDNLDSLQLLARYLAGSPYRLIALSDPAQLPDAALQAAPAAIVLDVMMPGIDGWELLARLREHPQTSAIPVIISTILPEQELASLLGAADFLQKPVTRERLLATLARHVQNLPA